MIQPTQSNREPHSSCLPQFTVAGLAALLLVPVAAASDHADPIDLDRLEGGITDLFVFPAKDGRRRVNKKSVTSQEANQLAVVFCVRRSLTTSPPYPGLDEFTYSIFMDLHSTVHFDNELDRKRYGGIVAKPDGIDADFAITIQLNNDTSIKEMKVEAKQENKWKVKAHKKEGKWEVQPKGPFDVYSGVRDDPFIFPMFFGTNVIAMVMNVPLDYFPGAPQDFLIWGTSARHQVQIDHVGRSQRTQLPRFDLLNTLHPKEHVAALRKQDADPGLKDDFLRTRIRPVFNLRPYDFQPDVMIFTRRPGYQAEFPNGRQLEDDVAYLTCMQGDCQLYELSFAVKNPEKYKDTGGRPTKNDKEFSDYFPYLAEPWPDKDPTPPPALTMKNKILLVVLILFVAVVFLFPWVLYFRALRRLRTISRQSVPLRNPPSNQQATPAREWRAGNQP
jgi:hypothetical protein